MINKYEMDSLDWRALVAQYMNGSIKEEEILGVIDAKRCCTCGCVELEEYMHENEDGAYCDTCWEAR